MALTRGLKLWFTGRGSMRLCVLILVMACCVAAQTLTLTSPATVTAGGSGTLTLTLSDSAGKSISAIQWTAIAPSGLSYGAPVLSQTLSQSGGMMACGPGGTCMVYSISVATMTDGVVVTIPVTAALSPPASVTINLAGLLAANAQGVSVGLAAGPNFALAFLSRCDLNSDGTVNMVDVQIAMDAAGGKGRCPAWLSACNQVTAVNEIIAAAGEGCHN